MDGVELTERRKAMALTEEDKLMIRYFWEEKGDLTRWASWETKLPEIEKELPLLVDALRRLDMAKQMIDIVVENL